MPEGCSGDNFTSTTETQLDLMLEQISIAKGKGQISEDNYDELVSQAQAIREANNKIKCLVDNLPKETVTPESIVAAVDEEITG